MCYLNSVELCPKGGKQQEINRFFSPPPSYTSLGSGVVQFSSKLGKEPSAPRTASRQQHGVNAPHDTPEEYYRRDPFIPFLD